jgi:hypothetical protein
VIVGFSAAFTLGGYLIGRLVVMETWAVQAILWLPWLFWLETSFSVITLGSPAHRFPPHTERASFLTSPQGSLGTSHRSPARRSSVQRSRAPQGSGSTSYHSCSAWPSSFLEAG